MELFTKDKDGNLEKVNGIHDDVAVEVYRVVHVVLGRTGKSGLDRGRELQRQFLGKFSFYDFHIPI